MSGANGGLKHMIVHDSLGSYEGQRNATSFAGKHLILCSVAAKHG